MLNRQGLPQSDQQFLVDLTDAAVVLSTERGVVIGDEFGSQLFEGRDLAALSKMVLPLLDGTHSRQEIVDLLEPSLAGHVTTFLTLLGRRSVLRESSRAAVHSDSPRQAPTPLRDSSSDHVRSTSMAKVIVYGLEPWGVEAARHLARAGVRSLVLVDPDSRAAVVQDSAEVFATAARLSAEAPQCKVLAASADDLSAHLAELSAEGGLLVVALRRSAVPHLVSVSRLAHIAGVPQLYGTLKGVEAIIGPLVVPHRSACWNCWRLRETACSPFPWAERLVQAEWEARTTSRGDPAPVVDPMAAVLGAHLAFSAITFLTGLGPPKTSTLRVHNFVTSAMTEHRVMQMPRCRVCGGAPQTSAQRQSDLDSCDVTMAREVYECWLDPRVGVVKRMNIVRSDICPTLIRAYADLSVYTDDTALSDRNGSAVRVAEKCGGKGFNTDAAVVGALGEAVERYSAALPSGEVHSAQAEDLEGDVLDPSKLALYGSHQYARPGFPYRRYDPRAHYPWVRGEWLDGTGDVWLPANLVHYTPPGREALAQVTTNGLAAGCGWEDAARRATLELVERDAFLRMWITRAAPTRLDLGRVDCPTIERVARLVRDLEAHDLALRFYLLPAVGDVTVVLCLGLGDGRRWPGAIVGTAAALDPRSAVEKAALEQAYTALYLRDVLASGRRLPRSDAEVTTFLDHALRYAGTGTRRRLSFIVDTARMVRLSDLSITSTSGQVSLREFALRLGVPVAIADVTAGDVAATGVRVVRALSPDLQPLHCGTGLERLGNRQLFRGAGRLYTRPHPMC